MASARSVPAINSASELNAAVASSTRAAAAATPAADGAGDQPSASATAHSTAIWIACTPSTASVLAASSPNRDSGVAPSRLSTP